MDNGFARNFLSCLIIQEMLPQGSKLELRSCGYSPLGYNEWVFADASQQPALFRTTCITVADESDVILTVEEGVGEDSNYELSELALELMRVLNVPSITKSAYLYALKHQKFGEAHYEVGNEELLAQMRKAGEVFDEAARSIATKFGITIQAAELALVEHQQQWNA